MHTIESNGYQLEIGSILESSFQEVVNRYTEGKIFFIVDENTHEHCLTYLLTNFEGLYEAEVIVIPSGEPNKTMQIAHNVWEVLSEYETSRYDLIINLGGGLVTDMGGFIASCYKRGMAFVNIPTTMLGMIDASIGGKTGLNLGHFKNQIGVFNTPLALYIDTIFLETLPHEEMLSGYAEMIKHGLLTSREMFDKVIKQIETPKVISQPLLHESIAVKNEIVKQDPVEKGLRKTLNLGHTIGHAIEGHYLDSNRILHGHAVAIGIIMESFISRKRGLLSDEEFQHIETSILKYYDLPKFSNDDIKAMIELLSNDKKNRSGKILSCLLEGMGNCTYDHELNEQEVTEAFLHYKNMQINLN